jgi:hypothetical protein
MRFRLAVFGFAFAFIAVVGACSSEEDAKVCAGEYTPPASFDPNTPQVTFSRDVFPLFKTCATTTNCHGTANNENHVFISPNDPRATVPGLVNVPSKKLPSMVYVKPGDPNESFLMKKLDGSHCALDRKCVGGTCGDQMPNKETQFPVNERDTVRRWIAQGAKND